MLVALPDPDNYRVTSLLPETPLAFPTVVVSSTNDPRMRPDKSAFWAGFWSASFVSIGAAGSIDEDSGFARGRRGSRSSISSGAYRLPTWPRPQRALTGRTLAV